MDMTFLPVSITPEQLVEAARYFKGVRYSSGTTVAEEDIDRALWQCDCAGFMILTARRLGLLPADFPVGLSHTVLGEERSRLLNDLLVLNYDRIELEDRMPGDLLRFKIRDGRERHVAIFTSWEPEPHGSIIHANNYGGCAVYEQRLTAIEMNDVSKAYRLKHFMGGVE